MQETGTTVTIQRTRAFVGALRPYRILLDGTEVLKLKNGETRSLLVPPGSHVLTVKTGWIRSKPYALSVLSTEPIRLACITTASDLLEYFKATVGVASDYLRIAPIESMRLDLDDTPRQFPLLAVAKRSVMWLVLVLAVGVTLAAYLESHAASPARGEQLSNLIGRLTGYLAVGGIAWIALQSAAARAGGTRVVRANRIMLIGLLGLWLCAAGAGFVLARRQPSGHSEFLRGCSESCLNSGADSATCTSYCKCMADDLLDGDLRAEFAEYTKTLSQGRVPDTKTRATIEGVQEKCRVWAEHEPSTGRAENARQ